MKAMLEARTTDRSWLQWSLRSLLVALLGFGIVFAWWGAKVRKEVRIQQAVELIAASSGWFDSNDYDPIAVVRAVNALHALGKEDAIDALRRFAKAYPSDGSPDNKHEAMRLIVPLLFDRMNPEDRFPMVYASDPKGTPYSLENREWWVSHYVTVVGDIPFRRVGSVGFGGAMEDFSYSIEWAQQRSRFRTTPLAPSDSPFDAADRVILELRRDANRVNRSQEVVDGLKTPVREQVLTALSHLLPATERNRYRYMSNWDGFDLSEAYCNLGDENHWAAFKKMCEPMHIRWSDERQMYVAEGSQTTP